MPVADAAGMCRKDAPGISAASMELAGEESPNLFGCGSGVPHTGKVVIDHVVRPQRKSEKSATFC
jgi:hypothetical protein